MPNDRQDEQRNLLNNEENQTINEVNAESQETIISIESESIIAFNNQRLKGKKIRYANEEITVEIEIENKVFKKTFLNDNKCEQDIRILNLNDEINQETLYDLGFRTNPISFGQSIINNWVSNLITSSFSLSSALGTGLLMSKDGTFWPDGSDGNGIWSADQASDGVGISARTVNALAPLILTLLTNYVNDNKYAWEKNKFNMLQTAIAVGDLTAMVATLGETYAFNRGNLAKEDIYRPGALFEKDNFAKVYWNDFSKWFLPEQIVRTFKNGIKIFHYLTGSISEETVNNIEEVSNYTGALIVSGAFANVTYGIQNYQGTNPGHGIEVLPNDSKIKSTIGILLAALGANYGSFQAVKEAAKSVWPQAKSLIKSCMWYFSNQEENNSILTSENPTINTNEYSESIVSSLASETTPIIQTKQQYGATTNIPNGIVTSLINGTNLDYATNFSNNSNNSEETLKIENIKQNQQSLLDKLENISEQDQLDTQLISS